MHKEIKTYVNDAGRFTAISSCGIKGYGRTREEAINDCLRNIKS